METDTKLVIAIWSAVFIVGLAVSFYIFSYDGAVVEKNSTKNETTQPKVCPDGSTLVLNNINGRKNLSCSSSDGLTKID